MTKVGDYNLIVIAMSTKDYPCPIEFLFTFKEQELRNYYQYWGILQYNEDIGELHEININGNRIKLKFVMFLANKR